MKTKNILNCLIIIIFYIFFLIPFSFCQNNILSIQTDKKEYQIKDTVYLLINNNDTNKTIKFYIDLDYIKGNDTLIYLPEEAIKESNRFYCVPSKSNNNNLIIKERNNEGGALFVNMKNSPLIKFYVLYNMIPLNKLYRFRLFYFEYPDEDLKFVKVTCSNPFFFKK